MLSGKEVANAIDTVRNEHAFLSPAVWTNETCSTLLFALARRPFDLHLELYRAITIGVQSSHSLPSLAFDLDLCFCSWFCWVCAYPRLQVLPLNVPTLLLAVNATGVFGGSMAWVLTMGILTLSLASFSLLL